VPSVSHHNTRLAVLALCGVTLVGALSGCSTTEEKAERQQARATHILKARADRQKQKKHDKGKSKQNGKGSQQ
jgi:outer membrane lipoprotein-sorting protein